MCRPKVGNGSGELANPQETPEDRSRLEKLEQTGGNRLKSVKIVKFFNCVVRASVISLLFEEGAPV